MTTPKTKKATTRKTAKKASMKKSVEDKHTGEAVAPMSIKDVAALSLEFALDALGLDQACLPHLVEDFAVLLEDAVRTDLWLAEALRAHFVGLGNDLPVPEDPDHDFNELLFLDVFVCCAKRHLSRRNEQIIDFEKAGADAARQKKSGKLKKARAKKRQELEERKKRARAQQKARREAAAS